MPLRDISRWPTILSEPWKRPPLQLRSEDVDTKNTATIERIKAKLADLRQLDPAYTLFGARSHRYVMGPPLSVSELADYEKRLGGPLPPEYRDFIMAVGHGGAGPFYGLFRLDGSDPEDITDLKELKKPFRWTGATNPMQWENAGTVDGVWMDNDVNEGESPIPYLNVPGALYICTYGCALRFFLIVNGLGVGEVWMDRQADGNGITPERDKNGRKLRFLKWYEKWLDDGISSFKQ
jgi:hypothetical protein